MIPNLKPDTTKLRRRQTQIKREREQDASEVRKAVERSDPKAIGERDKLPDKDRSERRHFIFYQDEGGLRATTQTNEPIDTIYYLGIIDILTPYGIRKALENFFKGFVHDKVCLSILQYHSMRIELLCHRCSMLYLLYLHKSMAIDSLNSSHLLYERVQRSWHK